MALVKRKNIWWIDISHEGRRIRQSTGTSTKNQAQQYHDQLKQDLWQQKKLKAIPKVSWTDAVLRWLAESTHKRSLELDKFHLRWIDAYFRPLLLTEINADVIENLAKAHEASGVSLTTVNRMLEVVRAILNKAYKVWGWLTCVPVIRMRQINNKRVRWLKDEEFQRLKAELPSHLYHMALFTLCTGLREANVTQLKWQDINFHHGTNLHELQQLDGWSNYETVLRYAHLSGNH